MNLADRMSRLGTETAFEILAKAKALEAQGREIIHLEIGEPDFDTPEHIKAAGIKALQAGETGYTASAGVPALRDTIAQMFSDMYNRDIQPAQVVVTPGAKPIMFFAILALLQPGDEAIYPNPGFPIYESMINFVGAKAVALPLIEEKGFRFDPDEFQSLITDRTKLIVLNSPANPTGGVLNKEDLTLVANIARERNIMVLTDEIYDRILYDDDHVSMLSVTDIQDNLILLNGFSKTYAMTGWRLGYGIMPVDLAEQMGKLMVNSNSCTATFTQFAGVEALTGTHAPVDEMVAAFKERRDYLVAALNDIPGFSCVNPKGAFYVFPNVKETGIPSNELADMLLNKAGVALLDGSCFGAYGQGYLRMSYANSLDNIKQAVSQIRDALAN